MYVVEYQTSSMIDSKRFVYEYAEELYQTNEIEYVNETTGQVLTINKDKYEYSVTQPLRVHEN